MIEQAALNDFRSALRGTVLVPGDSSYDITRQIFNSMIDKRPAAIARCMSAADVVASVLFARSEGLEVSMRGGGHNVSGKAVSDGGVMIDLAPMKSCRVDQARRVARAEPGLTLAEIDRDCQAFGLATPLGVVSATGIAGLTLGGGIGWLGGKHGLACDNILSADVVTADGRLLVASATENPDLYWAVRGGGANVGVVTSFEYQLHPVGPVIGGGILFARDKARRVLRFYGEFSRNAPDELSANLALSKGEDGVPVVGVGVGWCGRLDDGERVLKPLRSVEPALGDAIAPMRLVDLQSGGDGAFPRGRRHYWKAAFLRRLDGPVIDVLVDFAATCPSPYTMLVLQQMHGVAARVPAKDTAFAHRYDQWDCMLLSQWEHPANDERNVRWTREAWTALQPHVEQTVYVNDLDADDGNRVRQAYGENYERLVAVKAKYDPDNFFHGNQNVATAA